ncbi:hypothetical protein [Demequina phytophila]|uniref:hypothetical protein n=1 Tax=Demequina phytophila TaxID=1638981 RepID=UPI0007866A6A|nr:hypothetical protein [Demequina phytophila]
MTAESPAPGAGTGTPPPTETQRARRTVGAFVVATSTIIWWPAFQLGAWGQVFFEQILLLWAAATAALLVVLLKQGGPRPPGPLLASLALPSLWVVAELATPPTGGVVATVLRWFGAAVTLVGLPAMLWVLLTTLRHDLVEAVPARGWLAAAGVVTVIAVLSALLGWLHPYYLTCEDFSISGNSPPAGCTPAP